MTGSPSCSNGWLKGAGLPGVPKTRLMLKHRHSEQHRAMVSQIWLVPHRGIRSPLCTPPKDAKFSRFFLFLLFSSLLISYRPEGLGTLLLRLCSLLQRQGCLAAEPGLRLSILQWRGRPSLQAIENPAQLGMLG